MKLDTFIFKHFAPIPFKQWKQKIQYELKGADYQKTLVSTTNTGIIHLPFYTQAENKELLDVKKKQNTLKAIHITVSNALEANNKVLEAIKKGVDAVFFLIYDKEIDTTILCKNITIPLIVSCQFLNINFVEKIKESYQGPSLKILTDPFGKLTKTGNWYRDIIWDIEQLQHTLNFNNGALAINTAIFHNAGASQIQQLSYTICQILDYNKQLDINSFKSITYKVSVSTDLYIEIAKIKALRILHGSISKWLNISLECTIVLLKNQRNIQAINTSLNNTINETEQLIGIAGGVSIITSLPQNICFFKEDVSNYESTLFHFLDTDFNEKSLLFDNTVYIEKLTQQLVLKSTELINSIEQGGGFLAQFKKGIIHKKIEEKAIFEQKNNNPNWKVLIDEKTLLNKTPLSYPFFKYSNKKTQYRPLIEKRLTAPSEKPIWDSIYKND